MSEAQFCSKVVELLKQAYSTGAEDLCVCGSIGVELSHAHLMNKNFKNKIRNGKDSRVLLVERIFRKVINNKSMINNKTINDPIMDQVD